MCAHNWARASTALAAPTSHSLTQRLLTHHTPTRRGLTPRTVTRLGIGAHGLVAPSVITHSPIRENHDSRVVGHDRLAPPRRLIFRSCKARPPITRRSVLSSHHDRTHPRRRVSLPISSLRCPAPHELPHSSDPAPPAHIVLRPVCIGLSRGEGDSSIRLQLRPLDPPAPHAPPHRYPTHRRRIAHGTRRCRSSMATPQRPTPGFVLSPGTLSSGTGDRNGREGPTDTSD